MGSLHKVGGASFDRVSDISVVRSSSLDVMDLLEQMETSDLQEGEGENKKEKEEEEESLMETSDLQEEKEEEQSRLLEMPSVIMVEGGVDPPTDDALEPETDTRIRKEAEPASPAPEGDNLPLQSDPDAGDNPPLQSDPVTGDNPPLQSDPDAGDDPPLQSDPGAEDNPPLQSDPVVGNREHLQPDSEIVMLVSARGLTCDDHSGLPSDSGAHSELPDYEKHHGLCGETPSPSLVVTESGGDNNYNLSGTALLREEDYQAVMAAAEWVGGKMDSPHPGVNTRREEDYQAMIVAAEWVGGKMEPLCPPRREEEEESDGFLMPECKDDRNVPVVVLESYSSGSDQSPCVHRDDRKRKVVDTTRTNSDAPAPPDPIDVLQPATSSQSVCKKSKSSNAPVIDEVIDVVGSPQTVRSQRPQGSRQPEGSQQGTTQGWYSRFVGIHGLLVFTVCWFTIYGIKESDEYHPL